MKKITLVLLLFPLLVFAQINEIQQSNEEFFINPVWNGADPWMIKEGDFYYYCFSANNVIQVSKSKK